MRLTHEELMKYPSWARDSIFCVLYAKSHMDLLRILNASLSDVDYELIDLKYCFCIRWWFGDILLREYYTYSPAVTFYFEDMEYVISNKAPLINGIIFILHGIGEDPLTCIKKDAEDSLAKAILEEIDKEIMKQLMDNMIYV